MRCCADLVVLLQDEGESSVPTADEVKVDDAGAAAADAIPDGDLDVSAQHMKVRRGRADPSPTRAVWRDEKEEEEGQKGRL